MKIDVITLFPKTVDAVLSESIIARARKKNILKLNFIDLRSFTKDKHRTVDDRPYGGGAGMIMTAEPLYQAVKSVKKKHSFVVLTAPAGRVFNQKNAKKLARKKHLIIICGHYEGIDARVESFVDETISIGDYVLTGGELPAAVIIDCVTRFLPEVFRKKETPMEESFNSGMLEAPHYTRPEIWRGKKVPKVLLSGNHKKISEWKKIQAFKITKKLRPDLSKQEENR